MLSSLFNFCISSLIDFLLQQQQLIFGSLVSSEVEACFHPRQQLIFVVSSSSSSLPSFVPDICLAGVLLVAAVPAGKALRKHGPKVLFESWWSPSAKRLSELAYAEASLGKKNATSFVQPSLLAGFSKSGDQTRFIDRSDSLTASPPSSRIDTVTSPSPHLSFKGTDRGTDYSKEAALTG
ncbi:hypothetical protein Pint_21190 [Pistacia integerrima]|uniref:Uncharacterized protein n=1 Tax=Pistacia integerrima TaxID=434235 RepID=A0ACC0XCQ7_9ROSI|nr:hypothetical protein Pint_21190 [Pistacia integerrima]